MWIKNNYFNSISDRTGGLNEGLYEYVPVFYEEGKVEGEGSTRDSGEDETSTKGEGQWK
jgi:hypothetical protein